MSRICIIGSLNTEVLLGPAAGIPSWGSQLLVEEGVSRAAGSAVCAALPLKNLGVAGTVVGTVGDDPAGAAILQRMGDHGLSTKAIETVRGLPTGMCVSVFRDDAERLYISSLGAILGTTRSMIERVLPCDAGIVLLTGLFVLPGLGLTDAASLFRQFQEDGRTVCLDTGWDSGDWRKETLEALRLLLCVTDVFLPNTPEAFAITGKRSADEAARTLRAMGPRTVIVKRGREGALGVFDDRLVEHGGFPAEVRDTTAAGEAFNAGVLYAMQEGFDPESTLSFANAVASLFLTNRGEPATLTDVYRLCERA